MKQEHKIKLKNCLEKKLNRTCQPHELLNAETDVGLLVELLLDRVDVLEKLLEKK